jgi:hypothetical protein
MKPAEKKNAPVDAGCPFDDPAHPLVQDAPGHCHQCQKPLCLRQQVINLALGNTDEMLCLPCLSKENEQPPEAVLERLKHYIQERQCFQKEWVRYANINFCPDRNGCLPQICFPNEIASP